MDEITTTRLTIEIGASSNEAVEQLNQVSDGLRNLQKYSKQNIKINSDDVSKAHKRVSALSNILNSLKRIAFYRVIRSAIKAVGEAFSEGAENAYWYSKTMGDSTRYIADAYDNLSSGSFKMSNQLGAAWATLKATITPILIEIVKLVTRAAAAIAQFFAVLGGRSTYLKAIDYSKAWADTTAAGAGAAKEWKNQLMGFDEINRLEEPSAGGGGGGAALPDYGSMFEEAELSAWTDKVKTALSWVKDHLDLIKAVAIGIGAAILAWKLINFLNNLFKIGLSMQQILGFAIAIGGAVVYSQGFIDAWKNGPDWDNIAEMIGGVTAAAIGLGLSIGGAAAGIVLLVGGIGMLAIGLKQWITTGTLSTKAFWLMEAGIVAVGIGISLLTGSWIPAIVAAAVGMALAVYNNWDSIVQKTSELRDKVVQKWDEIKTNITAKINSIRTDISNGWTQMKNSVVQRVSEMWSGVTEKWEGIRSTISGKISQIKNLLNFSWSLPKPKMPHIDWWWQDIGGILSIPRFTVSWYAQGGIVDGATLIGAGEAGKEAIIPLERNTEWIGKVAAEMNAIQSRRGQTEAREESIADGIEDSGIITVLYQILSVAQDISRTDRGTGSADFDSFVRSVTRVQRQQARAAGTV